MTKYVPPKKSASLMILRDCLNIQNNNLFDYKILFLLRNSNISWANMMAFPGGNQDPEDIDYFQKNINKFSSYYDTQSEYSRRCLIRKLVALRETYEETGLYFLKNELLTTDQFGLLEQVLDYHKNDSRSLSFNELSHFFEFDIPKCYPFVRLVTVPMLKSRYDCQFFLIKANIQNLINIPKSLQNITYANNLDELDINKEESSTYKWLNPIESLRLYYKKEILLAPPQFMILNILCNFKKHFELIAYINKLNENSKHEGIARDPLTFPNLLSLTDYQNEKFTSDGFKYCVALPGDRNYPLQKILDYEKDIDLRKEFEDRYQGFLTQKQNNAKFYFQDIQKLFNSDYELEIKVDFDTPFKYMKNSRNLKEIL